VNEFAPNKLSNMFSNEDEQKIRDLRLDYKIKWLEKIFKDFVKEALTEHRDELKKLNDEKSPLLTIEDIAKRFKVTKATIHNWINRSWLTGNKVGKNRYFTEEEARSASKKCGLDRN
jgi:HTH domain